MRPQRWIPLLIILLFLGLFLNVPALPTLTVSLMVVIGVAAWWRDRALKNIHYARRFHYTRAFPGETVEVRVDVENRKLMPVSWLRIRDSWPTAVGPTDEAILAPMHIKGLGELINIFTLRWFERTRRRYELTFRKRGVYSVGPTRLESGDLFGIYQDARALDNREKLTVFPELANIDKLLLEAEDPFGNLKSRRQLFEDPNRPMGVREYRPEDEFRRVHWPATARTGELKVKVYQPTSEQKVVVCLNAATFPRHWEGVYPEMLEELIRVSASVAYHGINDGYQVGLISNGTLSNSDQPFRILPGSSTAHLAHVLRALAGVTPLVTAPFERFLMFEMPRIPYGASLVLITALTTPELAETLMRIKTKGRRVTLVSLAKNAPPELPGINAVHLPFREDEQLESIDGAAA
jgi:uncharacterized protein (DUF58 family)